MHARTPIPSPLAAARRILLASAGILLVFAARPAAADDLPHPKEVFRRILDEASVKRATGAVQVRYNAKMQVAEGGGQAMLVDGLMLFMDPSAPDDLRRANQVQARVARFASAAEARAAHADPLPSESAREKRISQPVSRRIGDGARTWRVAWWPGSDTETRGAQGDMVRGRYYVMLQIEGWKGARDDARLEQVLVALLERLARGLPTERGSGPATPAISSVNRAPRITSLLADTPRNEAIIAHDLALKMVAQAEDDDGDDLSWHWRVADGNGRELYAGPGKKTRGGSTLLCTLRGPEDPPTKGPLQVSVRIEDGRGGADEVTQPRTVIQPIAKLSAWMGDVVITRKFERLQRARILDLYDGDKLTIHRDQRFYELSPQERTKRDLTEERLTFAIVTWPKYGVTGKFLTRRSSPTRWFTVQIGRRPPVWTSYPEAMRMVKDQLFSLGWDKLRDKGVEAMISRLPATARATLSPVYEIAMSPDSLADSSVFVELHSEVLIRGDGAGGVGMWTYEGAPMVIEPNGRHRFEFPAGTWTSIDPRGARPRGAFDDSQRDPVWARLDTLPAHSDPAQLSVGAAPAEGQGGTPWTAITLGLVLLVFSVLFLARLRAGAAR